MCTCSGTTKGCSTVGIKVGVLALQGDVSEHIAAFSRALSLMGCEAGYAAVVPVRRAGEIAPLDALVIPGGESTTISRLIDKNRMRRQLHLFDGGIFATCAGMVLVADEVDDPRVEPLGLVDMRVDRNAFGRQRESFEADIDVKGLKEPFHAIFIRAPLAVRTGPGVVVLAEAGGGAVAVRQGRVMALSFHPELGGDLRLHMMFLEGIEKTKHS